MKDEWYMVWYDNDFKKPVGQRIEDGMRVFEKHFGQAAMWVEINPADAAGVADEDLPDVHVWVNTHVLVGHFWLSRSVKTDQLISTGTDPHPTLSLPGRGERRKA